MTCGIGFLVLVPYIISAHAVFYRSIMPKPDEESFSELPTVTGKEALSKRANAIILAAVLILFAAIAALMVKVIPLLLIINS
jgi:hypothetical protein